MCALLSGGKDSVEVMKYVAEMNAFVDEFNWGRDLRRWDAERTEERRVESFPFVIDSVMEYNAVHKLVLFGCRVTQRIGASTIGSSIRGCLWNANGAA